MITQMAFPHLRNTRDVSIYKLNSSVVCVVLCVGRSSDNIFWIALFRPAFPILLHAFCQFTVQSMAIFHFNILLHLSPTKCGMKTIFYAHGLFRWKLEAFFLAIRFVWLAPSLFLLHLIPPIWTVKLFCKSIDGCYFYHMQQIWLDCLPKRIASPFFFRSPSSQFLFNFFRFGIRDDNYYWSYFSIPCCCIFLWMFFFVSFFVFAIRWLCTSPPLSFAFQIELMVSIVSLFCFPLFFCFSLYTCSI